MERFVLHLLRVVPHSRCSATKEQRKYANELKHVIGNLYCLSGSLEFKAFKRNATHEDQINVLAQGMESKRLTA